MGAGLPELAVTSNEPNLAPEVESNDFPGSTFSRSQLDLLQRISGGQPFKKEPFGVQVPGAEIWSDSAHFFSCRRPLVTMGPAGAVGAGLGGGNAEISKILFPTRYFDAPPPRSTASAAELGGASVDGPDLRRYDRLRQLAVCKKASNIFSRLDFDPDKLSTRGFRCLDVQYTLPDA